MDSTPSPNTPSVVSPTGETRTDPVARALYGPATPPASPSPPSESPSTPTESPSPPTPQLHESGPESGLPMTVLPDPGLHLLRYSNVPLTPGINSLNSIENGEVLGGHVTGVGVDITWQCGPAGPCREGVNGAFVEDVIEAVIQRLVAYERTKYAHKANKEAIAHLKQAIYSLNSRMTTRRTAEKLGTGEV